MFGSASKFNTELTGKPPEHLVIIIVNAAVAPTIKMDGVPDEPSLAEQIDAVSSAQIDRNSLQNTNLLKESITAWAEELSQQSGIKISPHFIQIDFSGIQDKQKNKLLNTVSTSLALPPEQVGGLRKAARQLLEESAEFQQLLKDLK